MEKKELLYTNESNVELFENGEVFYAKPTKDSNNTIPFNVSTEHIIERKSLYLVIDTGSDADL